MMASRTSFENNNGGLAANEEWPEIISVARIGQRQIVKTELGAKKTKKLDIKNISADDLKSIQKKDPFMYYSIPGVRSAKVLMKDIDTSNLKASGIRNCISCPSRLQTVQDKAQSQTVTRSSRISFECHPDLLLEDLLNDVEDCDLEGTDDEPFEFLMATIAEQQC